MLIKALCDYYNKVMVPNKYADPKGYESVRITHTIYLNTDGTIDNIIDNRDKNETIILPKRLSKSAINAEIIEHRPSYIFGLEYDKENDKFFSSDKSKKSNESFKEKNFKFVEGMDSDIVNAYRNFILTWDAGNETRNDYLMEISRDYNKSKFEFRLAENSKKSLQDDEQVKIRWDCEKEKGLSSEGKYNTQCAVLGEDKTIARIHNKIKGIGRSTGAVLVSFENADCSYGREQSYNSNISNDAMEKYTEALKYILDTKNNKIILGDIIVTFWAIDKESKCEECVAEIIGGRSNKEDAEDTQKMLKGLILDAKKGNLSKDRISVIDSDVDFYIVGLQPNSARIAVKFIYHRKYGDILENIAKYQSDMQASEDIKIIPFWKIKKAISPLIGNKTSDQSEIITKLFKSIIYGYKYPEMLLSIAVNRVKIEARDSKDKNRTELQAAIIKGCLNRKSLNKEELKMSLDENNQNSAYICGRLFAVLEKIQIDSVRENSPKKKLNRTIKDSYFSAACSTPASIFPQILKLSQYHLEKLENEGFKIGYKKLIGTIINKLDGSFPKHFSLDDQGRFIIGYYHQTQDFYKSKKEQNDNEEEI